MVDYRSDARTVAKEETEMRRKRTRFQMRLIRTRLPGIRHESHVASVDGAIESGIQAARDVIASLRN